MRSASAFIEPFRPLCKNLNASQASFGLHRILGYIGFRSTTNTDSEASMALERDAYLRRVDVRVEEVSGSRPSIFIDVLPIEASDYLNYHPLVLRSFATKTPVTKFELHVLWRPYTLLNMKKYRPVLVRDLICAIHDK